MGMENVYRAVVLPRGTRARNCEWDVDSIGIGAVAGYKANNRRGVVNRNVVTNRKKVVFYWVEREPMEEVSVSCDIKGVRCTQKIDVNVEGPTLLQYDSTTAGTKIMNFDTIFTRFGFGNIPGPPFGIEWEARVKGAKTWSGKLCFVQEVGVDYMRKLWVRPGGDYGLQITTAGEEVLDTTFAYGGTVFDIQAMEQTVTVSHDDTPGFLIPTTSWDKLTAKGRFFTYLMFKPESGLKTIWVPVGYLYWTWEGTATRLGTTWTVTEDKSLSNPIGRASWVFPEWEKNFTQFRRRWRRYSE